MAKRVSKSKSNVFLRRRGLLPADHRRGAHPRRKASALSWWSARPPMAPAGRVRRPAPVPERQRARSRPRRPRSPPQGQRRRGRRRHRPDGAGAAQVAGRHGRRHRPRFRPALRRADGLRRPARRLLRHPRTSVRSVPGRIIGVSRTPAATRALRMALQTREQHIRRERPTPTSAPPRCCWPTWPACTPCITAREGLRTIAARIHRLAAILRRGLEAAGFKRWPTLLRHHASSRPRRRWPRSAAPRQGPPAINLRRWTPTLGVALDETTRTTIAACSRRLRRRRRRRPDAAGRPASPPCPAALLRTDAILPTRCSTRHHTEHEMLRYLKRLQNKRLALDHR